MDPIMAAAIIVADILIKTRAITPPPTQEDAELLVNKCYELVLEKMGNLQKSLNAEAGSLN
jgi:hypothetical protein